VNVIYSARYDLDLGSHVFPASKYRLVHDQLLRSGTITPSDVIEPEPASWSHLALVHTPEYLAKMRDGTLTPDERAQLQLPWSRTLVDAFQTMVGGTTLATLIACGLKVGSQKSEVRSRSRSRSRSSTSPSTSNFRLHTSNFNVVCHIGGGLHHAFPGHGEGFCPFNDVAVATRSIQGRGFERVAIIDLDVHHGNGTAFIFESDRRVFTFSMHQQYNYPAWKPRGSLDIGLADGTGDETFLARLQDALPAVLASEPECVFYLAGADPYEDDQLGGLRLTRTGLRTRDRMVIEAVRLGGHPLVVVLAGGYGRRLDDTVAIHVATIEEAGRASAAVRSG
jgi:acetoin utilization deacetylase AcuC-like enzyme